MECTCYRKLPQFPLEIGITCFFLRYVLTHQEQDSAGEMETRLVKGDILPTSTGGSQVVFQDVEVSFNLFFLSAFVLFPNPKEACETVACGRFCILKTDGTKFTGNIVCITSFHQVLHQESPTGEDSQNDSNNGQRFRTRASRRRRRRH